MDAEAAKLIGAGLAAIGAGTTAKRLALAYVLFKVIAALIAPTASRVACSSASPLPNFSACWRSSLR